MGRLKIDKRYLIWSAAGLAIIVVASLGIWWFGTERLPGYNIDPVARGNYVEPGGAVSEYFTGHIKTIEISIIGPKLTVTGDLNNSDRTFYVSDATKLWLGLEIGDESITGEEKAGFYDLKTGQRVAVFVGKVNTARSVHILKR